MSIAQFHHKLQATDQQEALETLRHVSYDDLQGGDGDQLTDWDPWSA